MLISELDVGDPVPIHSQIARIMDNEKIGINISNRGRRTLVIEYTLTLRIKSISHEKGGDTAFETCEMYNCCLQTNSMIISMIF